MRLGLAGGDGDLRRDARGYLAAGVGDLDLCQERAGLGGRSGTDEADAPLAGLAGDETDLGALSLADPAQGLLRHLDGNGERVVVHDARDGGTGLHVFALAGRQRLDAPCEGGFDDEVADGLLGACHVGLGDGQRGAGVGQPVVGGDAALEKLRGIVEFAPGIGALFLGLGQRGLGASRVQAGENVSRFHPVALGEGHLDHRARGLGDHLGVPVGQRLTLGAVAQRDGLRLRGADPHRGWQRLLGGGLILWLGTGEEEAAAHPSDESPHQRDGDPERPRGAAVGFELQRRSLGRGVGAVGHAGAPSLMRA